MSPGQTPAGASLRSTTNSYDGAGRVTGTSITSYVKGDVQVPASTLAYAPTTGLPLSVTAGGKSVSTGFDSWGQPASYTDAGGNHASTIFDAAGRVSTHADGKGTYSYGYDTPTEHRGLVTSQQAGVGGGLPDGFAVSYDAYGNPSNVTYPNGVTAAMGFNTVGALMSKAYKDSAGANIAGWSQTRDGWGRVSTAAGPSSQGARTTGFGYDTAGRLTTANDLTGANCVTRGYGFDTASNRLTKTVTTATATAGVCPTGTTTATTTGSFNTAAQLTATTITGAGAGAGAYVYDGLGRTSTVPAIDTNNPAGENLSLGFYSTDKPATQTLGASTQTWGLDPTGRADTTTTTTVTGATTTSSFFDGGSDSPAWTSTSTGSWTRFIDGPGGSLALQATGTGTDPTSANLMLINPHGDITATIPNTTNVPAAQISGINDTDEYGNVLNQPAPSPYGWVGAAQRSTNDQAGLIQMGARQYNPATGRFLTLDPTPGGNPNPYTYPPDPINGYDLSGQFSLGGLLSNVISAVIAPVRAVVNIAQAVVRVATHYARAAVSYVRSGISGGRRGGLRTVAGSRFGGIRDAISNGISWVKEHRWIIAEKRTLVTLNHEQTGQLAQDSASVGHWTLAPDAAGGLLWFARIVLPAPVAIAILVVTFAVGADAGYVHGDAQRAYDNGNCAALNSYRFGDHGYFGVDEVPCA